MLSNFFEKLPKDWIVKNFSDVAKITCGIAATPEYVDSEIGVPFLSARNVQNGKLDLSYYQHIPLELHEKLTKNTKPEKGDVLLTRVGAGIGQTAIVDIDFEFSIYVSLTLIKCGKSLDSEYVKSLLSMNYYEYLATRDQFAGGGVQNLNVQMVKNYPIPIPPIEEQKKIATILSTWDKAIETVEKLVANSQQQKKALMQQLLTGQKRLLDDNGVKFAGEWEEYSLGEWLKEYNQKSSTNNEYEVLTSSRNGLVKQSDYFGENRLVQRDNTGFNVIPPNYLTYRSRSDDGSFYFNRNNFEFNGLISTYYPVFEFPNGDTNFFLNLLNQNSTLFSAYSVGTSQKVLSLNALKQVKFRLPLKKEQEKIAQVLTLADREIDLYQQQLDKLKLEKKALMQQLLTGQKRVKLDS